MSGIPSGDKLKLEKINIPKGYEGTELGIIATVTGYGIMQVAPHLAGFGYGLSSIGVLLTTFLFIHAYNPYKNLLKNVGLEINDKIPRFVSKRTTDYGYCLTFSLPTGLSTDDFEKKKLAIEQYLNKRIDISYDNWKVFIRVFEKELEKSPKYEFTKSKNILEFAIGIAFGGKSINVDLEKLVHLLIAGETGSGKSTLLRGIITSLVLANRRIILHLIDLKNGAEFNVFRKCKQVKTFSRNIIEAEQVLNMLIKEVDRRYDLFFENDVVDIREYNRLKNVRPLEYQICIIDEFADLQDEKGSISAVEILAAKARACGIHLIIATQRPDAKILNGRIKANIPGVIGLKTMNELNSRIIIDQKGLEELRGRGHGLLKYSDITEFQSYFLTVADARELIKHTYIEKDIPKKDDVKIGKVDITSIKLLGGD